MVWPEFWLGLLLDGRSDGPAGGFESRLEGFYSQSAARWAGWSPRMECLELGSPDQGIFLQAGVIPGIWPFLS